jgi:hypothetical protein
MRLGRMKSWLPVLRRRRIYLGSRRDALLARNLELPLKPRVWVSLPHNPTLAPTVSSTGVEITIERRPSDWGLRGWRRAFAMARVCVSLARQARAYDAVVICTAGWELPLLGPLLALLSGPRLVAYDYLIPESPRGDCLTALALAMVDHIACCRRGDRETLERRFGVSRDRSSFVRFPAPPDPLVFDSVEDPFDVYSAGQSHRDTDSVIAVLELVDASAVVSLPDPAAVGHLGPRVRGLPPLSPDAGRRYLAACRISLQLYLQTDLPAGPLLLLDAMAAGKAIVVSDVNGTRDYVTDGKDAIVVAAQDVEAAAQAVESLLRDFALCEQLGRAARSRALEYSQNSWMAALLSLALPAHSRPDSQASTAGSR